MFCYVLKRHELLRTMRQLPAVIDSDFQLAGIYLPARRLANINPLRHATLILEPGKARDCSTLKTFLQSLRADGY